MRRSVRKFLLCMLAALCVLFLLYASAGAAAAEADVAVADDAAESASTEYYDASKLITVYVENLLDGEALLPRTDLFMTGSHLDALMAALAENGYDPESDMVADVAPGFAFVSSILGLGGDSLDTGWMCVVNGELLMDSINMSPIVYGDVMIMYYLDWNDTVYLPSFNYDIIRVTPGDTFSLTLTGADTLSFFSGVIEYVPIEGAEVYVRESAGALADVHSAVTDAEGRAWLEFSDVGVYTLSAARAGAVNATDLIPTFCTVVVSLQSPASYSGGSSGSYGLVGNRYFDVYTFLWLLHNFLMVTL